ncbi:MAG TPA: SHOCT domain-containing protein [Candidatus Hydrogenedentes bacterium]|jgi:hypothetical protein|nr:SHOCT domain-containing protein [Candidatus Hydrogenedentota bacterium]HPJ98480.1 SHOCT domain-containing protein [Candidatus Hydrogenedentota bacterium]
MLTGFITLLITDAMLLLVIQLVGALVRRHSREFPLHYAVLLLLFCILAHYAATSVMAGGISTERDRWLTLAATFGCGFFPIALYVATVFHHPAVGGASARNASLDEARKQEAEGNVQESLRAYCQYLDGHPKELSIWFETADMLQRNGEFTFARNLLIKMRDQFTDDDAATAKIMELWDTLPRPANSAVSGTGGAASDPNAVLQELIALRKQGAITEEEYRRQKRELFRG